MKRTKIFENLRKNVCEYGPSLQTTLVHMDPEEFEFVVDSCPLAEEVIILSAGLIDENLYSLMNLTRLTT